MRAKLGAASFLFLIICMTAQAEQSKVPAGCRAAVGAKASVEGYADRIVHEKTGIELVLIAPGTFTMGRGRQGHKVTIGNPFYVGKTEVTNAQYRRFVKASGYDGKADTDPAYDLYLRHWRGESYMSKEDNYPVVWVSWKNAKAFCKWAGLSLPTDAQWEYACRAGTTTDYYFGDAENVRRYEQQKEFDHYGWEVLNSDSHTHPVAQKKPNAWGLYDMLGNVWEWVEDDYIEGYDGVPTDGSARVEGKMTRVLRGGSWGTSPNPPHFANSSISRFNCAPTTALHDIGFRVVLPLEK